MAMEDKAIEVRAGSKQGDGEWVQVLHRCSPPIPQSVPATVGPGSVWRCQCGTTHAWNPPTGGITIIGHRYWMPESEYVARVNGGGSSGTVQP